MKKLYTYIGRYWYGYLFAVFSMVTAIVLDMLYPKITQQIVDDVIIGGKLELLTRSGRSSAHQRTYALTGEPRFSEP